MKKFFLISISLSFILIIGCAAHTDIEPIGKDNLSANFSVEGPIVNAFGTKIPVPYTTVGVDYGLNDKFDINGDFHLLSLPFKILGFDLGSTWFPCSNQGKLPTIGIQTRLLTLISLKSHVDKRLKIYPIISNSASWKINKGLIYIGSDITIPFSLSDYDENAVNTIFSPFLGYRWSIGKSTYIFTEIKWHGANVRTDQLAVEYLPINNYGALTTLFSIQRSF